MSKQFLLFLLIIPFLSFAQNDKLRLEAGLNYSDASFNSTHEINPKQQYLPLTGYILAANLFHPLNDKMNIRVLFSFENRRMMDMSTTYLTDLNGNITGQYFREKQSFKYLGLGATYIYSPFDKLEFGAGPKLKYLASATSQSSVGKVDITYLKPLNLALLLEVYYQLPAFTLFLKMDQDVISRTRDKRSEMKEFETVYSVGVTLKFKENLDLSSLWNKIGL